MLSDEEPAEENLKVLNFKTLLAVGLDHPLKTTTQNRETLATLMYTSGTSGKPKGVMLTHGNLLYQITTFGAIVPPLPGDRVLSILPSWHAYERTVEYYILSQGYTQIYTNIRYFKQDLQEFKPHLMVAVPRLWESVYEGVQKQFRQQSATKQKLVNFLLANSQRYIEARRIVQGLTLTSQLPNLPQRLLAGQRAIALWPLHALGEQLVYKKVREATGGQMKYAITGGGSLAMHLDTFFEIIGFSILMGYGLTETSPVTNVRRPWRNLRGSSGQPIPGTEIRIVDLETRHPLPIGQRGLVLVRGPQVMQGYLDAEATAKVIDSEGWFNTGDLGWVTAENDLVLTGRAKDTIVLTNGENVEPQPIEDACMRSPYINQIMVVGQDQRSLGALIVPNLEALQGVGSSEFGVRGAEERSLEERSEERGVTKEIDLESKVIQDLFRQELNREVQNRPGYRPDDRIGPFRLILEPFSIENGMLTQTLKIRRPVVMERYHDIINGIFA